MVNLRSQRAMKNRMGGVKLQAILWHVCLSTLCKVLDADHPLCPLVRTHHDKALGITTLRLLHSNVTSWPDIGLCTKNMAVQTPAYLAQRSCIAPSLWHLSAPAV